MRGTGCLLRSEGILLLLLQVYSAYADNFKVEVPVEPVSAHVGSSVLLPCRISTGVNAVRMEVSWVKNGNETVHVYASGADLESRQSSGFKGRTHLDKEALGAGNVSLQLNNVRVSDEGSYQCYVLSESWFTDSTMKLKVSALGRSPRFSLAGRLDSDVTLQCDSEGWFPKPDLQWRNVKGADLTGRAVLTEKPGADGLFTLQSALQISEQEADGVICLIRHGKERRVLQTRIHIGGVFFSLVAPLWKGFSVFFIVCLVLFALCISAAVYYYRKREATEEIQRQNLLAECDDLRQEIKSKGFVLKSEWKQIQAESVAVTLDPDTAHCRLIVSEDGKRVRNDYNDKNVPNTERRFEHHLFVLGREGFTSGRRYWEVEVGKRDSWKLGVASESAKRKGVLDLSPKEGYWVLQLRFGHELSALTDPVTPLKVLPPLKVGVHLDYEEGKLSFYRVEDRGVIYTFLGKFSGKLFPFFYPGDEDEELVILNKDTKNKDQSDNSVSLEMGPDKTGM
ncbi:butyrophilin subfamily 1 member A1-like [Acipenser ruthenus]|uniref:butyrophilin subfamily 1 member A1-like n=1 Tax=Acipenser ruthenus TaxID=7906 RepID=UPI002742925B|nr:butyrophilin subfamily 1 member A1-like [Acipenser ruthenus]